MFTAGLDLVIAATVCLIRGPRRDRALVGLFVGTAPFWFLAGHILTAMRPVPDRQCPPGGRPRSSRRWPSPSWTWYCLAFLGGGISLASGAGLALGSRYRDRRALRAA
jgi:hypothetical protein